MFTLLYLIFTILRKATYFKRTIFVPISCWAFKRDTYLSYCRADVGNPEFALQFGLLLELYCHAAVEHIDILIKQVEAINKMKTVTEILKGYKDQDVRCPFSSLPPYHYSVKKGRMIATSHKMMKAFQQLWLKYVL